MSPEQRPTVSAIRAALERALAPLVLDVIDDSAGHAGHPGASAGGHFRVRLVCASFSGRPQLERHRMVYRAVAALMGQGIHALSIEAHSPDETVPS